MAIEIEKKFLVTDDSWKTQGEGTHYVQGYLNTDKQRTVRVRTIGKQSFLTIKGISVGASRKEFEYEIPYEDGLILLHELCERPIIEKIRYKIKVENDLIWEIDMFLGENAGLVVAEIELKDENQYFAKPIWLGKEVTSDTRYFNSSLIKSPFSKWG
jgi:adenylate cyclase